MATLVDLHGLFLDNKTIDYEDYEYQENICLSSRVSDALAIFMPLLYSVGLLCGLLGNGLLLTILCFKRRNLSMMDIFILFLSITDCLLLLTLPFWAVDAFKGWILGTQMCKVSGVLFEINFYCGVFTLAFLSVDYYLSVVRGVQLLSHKKPVVFYCVIICVLCLLLSIPDWIFLSVSSDHGKQECTHHYAPESWRVASRLPHLFVLLVLVLVLLFFCSIVMLHLRHSSKSQQKKKGRSEAIIAALILIFFICWTPYSITFTVNTFQTMDSVAAVAEDCKERKWTPSKITATFGLLHCVVNPAIYLCFSKEFRRRILTVLKFSACKMENNEVSLWDSTEVNGNATVQEEQCSLQPMPEIKQTNGSPI